MSVFAGLFPDLPPTQPLRGITRENVDNPGGPSVWGFLTNLALGPVRVAQGLSTLGAGAAIDVFHGVEELATLGKAKTPGYYTPRALAALPGQAIEDIKKRYGTDVRHQLYENPFSYVLDALLLGGGASKVAELGEAGKIAGLGPESRFVRAVLPKTERVLTNLSAPSTERAFVNLTDMRNVVVRPAQKALRGLTLTDLGPLRRKLADLETQYEAQPLPATADAIVRYRAALEQADAAGVTRMERGTLPGTEGFWNASSRRLKVASNKIVARAIHTFTQDRNAILAGVHRILDKLPAPILDRFHRVIEGLDDGELWRLPEEDVKGALATAGFTSKEEAVQAIAAGDQRAADLHFDDRVHLLQQYRHGELDLEPGLPIPELSPVNRSMRPIPVPIVYEPGGSEALSLPGEARGVKRPVGEHPGMAEQVMGEGGLGPEGVAQQPTVTGTLPIQPFQDVPTMMSELTNIYHATLNKLRELFGPGVEGRIKPISRVEQKAERTGALPLDAIGFRVNIALPFEAKNAAETLRNNGFPIVAVDDTRAIPLATGQRRIALTVDTGRGLAEVEIGTPLWRKTRDALVPMEHQLEDLHYGIIEQGQRLTELRSRGTALEPAEHAELGQLENAILRDQDALRKGSEYVQSMWDSVADEFDLDLGRRSPGGVSRRVMNDLRLWVHQHLTYPLIADRIIDPGAIFDRVYLPQRIMSGAKWDQSVDDFVGGLDSELLHQHRMAQGLPMPIYFPHVDARRLSVGQYLMARMRVGALKAVDPGYLKRDTAALFDKRLNVTDPAEAYSRRAAAALRFRDTFDLIKRVTDEFARPLDDPLAYDKQTEKLFAPEGMLRFFSAKIGITDRMAADIAEDLGLPQDILKAAIQEHMGKTYQHLLSVTKRGMKIYAIPNVVADMLERHFKISGLEIKARFFWDTPNKVWRNAVLALEPRWIANNIVGNTIFLKMQGGKLTDVFRYALDPQFRQMVKDLMPNEDITRQVHTGMYDVEGETTHLGEGARRSPGRAAAIDAMSHTTSSLPVLRHIRSASQGARAVNSAVEDAFRSVSYMTALQKTEALAKTRSAWQRLWTSKEALQQIARRGVTGQRALDGVEKVNYFFNDYEVLGPVERHVIRRFFVPFYSFYKHVVRLALRYPIDYPGKAALFSAMARFDQEMAQEQWGLTPSWLRGAVPVQQFGPGDLPWLSGRSANPFTVLEGVFNPSPSLINMSYPAWRIITEQATGQSSLTGREFSDENVVVPFGASRQYRVTKDAFGRVVDVDLNPKTTPGLLEHALMQFPQYELLRTLAAMGKPYDTETLASILLKRATGQDPRAHGYSGDPFAPLNLFQTLGGQVGLPIYDYNVKKYQKNVKQEASDALKTFRRRHGGTGGGGSGGGSPFAGLSL